jgi:MFS family permease
VSLAARRPAAFVFAMCLAHVLTMLGFSSFPTLQPLLTREWGLSGAGAGAVNSAFFAGYTLAVPLLVSITDRIDPRRIYLSSLGLAVAGLTGFAFLADGISSAAAFTALYGASLAGTYMPGLRIMGEALPPVRMARATSFYTSSFGLGAALSYFATAQLAAHIDWRGIYAAAALCSAAAALIVWSTAPPGRPHAPERPWLAVLDPRPALRNRSALAYSLCYGLHSLELFTVRSWIVAFLAAVAVRQGTATGALTPASVAALLTLLGVGASIGGNETAIRTGRMRAIGVTMVASGGLAVAVAVAALYSYWLAAGLAVAHGCLIMFDSATLTAGAFGSAPPAQRGITMAVHSMIGFGGAIFGPLVFGGIVDVVGRETGAGWSLAYGHLALYVVFGPLILSLLAPSRIAGDRR